MGASVAAPQSGSPNDEVPATSGPEPGRPGRTVRWWPLVAGIVVLLATVWVFVTAWGAVWASHPAGWVTLLAAGAGGIAAIAFAVAAGPAKHHGWRRWVARAGLVVVAGLATAIVVYTKPLSADQVAIDALADGDGVTVTERATRIEMQPADPAGTGLAFYPGAKVDPRAYANVLHPIAEAGYPVVILKQPFNLAILGSNAASAVVGDADDDVDRWLVGGHSLGGAMAARYAETPREELVGLLLYAAYPVVDMSDRSDLAVASVWGTADTVADPADIDNSVDELPTSAVFTPIDGGIHSFFGDYGLQRGDGTPGISRDEAQAEIAAATLDLLDSIDAGMQSSG
jgi:hypothetical protein